MSCPSRGPANEPCMHDEGHPAVLLHQSSLGNQWADSSTDVPSGQVPVTVTEDDLPNGIEDELSI